MKITGKIYLFANKYQNKDGETITRCSTNVAENDKDGNVKSRFYLDVKFAGKKAPKKEDVEKLKDDHIYEIDVKDGFLGCKSYTNKDDELVVKPELVVLECEITDVKKVKKTETKKKKAKPSKSKKEDDDEEVDEEELPF